MIWTTTGIFALPAGLESAGGDQLYLGLIHHADAEGDRARVAAARQVVKRFGVATECGWGRTDPARVPELLAAHRRIMGDVAH